MKTATYIGGEFDAQLDEAFAIILGMGQPLTVNEKEIQTANLLVFDINGGQHVKFNVPHENNKIRSKNEEEETHHPYFVTDLEVIEKMTKSSDKKFDATELESKISDLQNQVSDLKSKITPTT